MATIQIRRGLIGALPELLPGEMGLTLDTKDIYIGIDENEIKLLGNMHSSVYDTNGTGIVDNSEKLNNQTPAYYRNRNNHTGTQLATTIVEDPNHLFTTTAEKTSWNGKADKVPVPDDDVILLCDTIGNPKLSSKSFNDDGTTSFDILSASKVIQLISASSSGGSKTRINALLGNNQTIPKNIWTKIEFDTETIDSLNEFSIVNHKFIPQSSGRYRISTAITFRFENRYYRSIRLYINGNPTNIEDKSYDKYKNLVSPMCNFDHDVELVAGDEIEIFAYQDESNSIYLEHTTSVISITRLV